MKAEELPTFVICLEKKAKERCDVNMESILEVFPKAQRTAAVDASTVDDDDIRISYYARHYKQQQKESDFMHLSKHGAVGCALSHIQLWKRCVQLGQPVVIVEDDMFLTKKRQQQIRKAVSQIPADCDFAAIMYLALHPMDHVEQCNAHWCDVQEGFAGLQMYYITPSGCSILLRDALPIVTHIDSYVGYVASVVKPFKALYFKKPIYTLTDALKDNATSSIGHGIGNIRKILPAGNMFYILFSVLLFLLFVSTIVLSVLLYNKSK